ncbi:MAG: 4-hydroxy-tetrahydrodipicolinate reductase, partial [Parvularculaceae bacterium]|nr:4-hydroxy-tetrahydrodipicolinate reductase [Parvularculaceae bacterium]
VVALLARGDVLIDFTTPAATLEHLRAAAERGIAAIVGTTGFSEADEAAIAAHATAIPIVKASNFSLGVALVAALVEEAARRLGDDFDIEIAEIHHRHKVDAPSGTALMLGAAAARGRGVPLRDRSVRVRDGITGPRRAGDIGFSVRRGGGVIGDHEVSFVSSEEMITLSHRALDRGLFAKGAVAAALWAHGRKPGLYSVRDVLGLA